MLFVGRFIGTIMQAVTRDNGKRDEWASGILRLDHSRAARESRFNCSILASCFQFSCTANCEASIGPCLGPPYQIDAENYEKKVSLLKLFLVYKIKRVHGRDCYRFLCVYLTDCWFYAFMIKRLNNTNALTAAYLTWYAVVHFAQLSMGKNMVLLIYHNEICNIRLISTVSVVSFEPSTKRNYNFDIRFTKHRQSRVTHMYNIRLIGDTNSFTFPWRVDERLLLSSRLNMLPRASAVQKRKKNGQNFGEEPHGVLGPCTIRRRYVCSYKASYTASLPD